MANGESPWTAIYILKLVWNCEKIVEFIILWLHI